MKRLLAPLMFLAFVLVASSCTGRVYTRGQVAYSEPPLVQVGAGVYVVEDAPYPVFWDDGYYWRYDSGLWLRSSYYDRGFVRVRPHVVPYRVRTIDRPRRYRHYRAPSRAHVRRGPPARARVRDHRGRQHRSAPRQRQVQPRGRSYDRSRDRRGPDRSRGNRGHRSNRPRPR